MQTRRNNQHNFFIFFSYYCGRNKAYKSAPIRFFLSQHYRPCGGSVVGGGWYAEHQDGGRYTSNLLVMSSPIANCDTPPAKNFVKARSPALTNF